METINYKIEFEKSFEFCITPTSESIKNEYVYSTFTEAKKQLVKMFNDEIFHIKYLRDKVKTLKKHEIF